MVVAGSIVEGFGWGVGAVAAVLLYGLALRRWERRRQAPPSWMTVKFVKRLRVAFFVFWAAALVTELSDSGNGHHHSPWRFVGLGLMFSAAVCYATSDAASAALRRRGLWPSRPKKAAPLVPPGPYVGAADKAWFREWRKRRHRPTE